MKRTIALLVVVFSFAVLAARAADSTKINGWISDSMCGAKHAGSGAACVKKCIDGGMQPVFVDESKKEVWKIDNPDAVIGLLGLTGIPFMDVYNGCATAATAAVAFFTRVNPLWMFVVAGVLGLSGWL